MGAVRISLGFQVKMIERTTLAAISVSGCEDDDDENEDDGGEQGERQGRIVSHRGNRH